MKGFDANDQRGVDDEPHMDTATRKAVSRRRFLTLTGAAVALAAIAPTVWRNVGGGPAGPADGVTGGGGNGFVRDAFAASDVPPLDTLPMHPDIVEPYVLSNDEWEKVLPMERYRVLRLEATEPPGSSPLNQEKRAGTFVCAGCNLALFDSATKFESGTGWPSFTDALPGRTGTQTDFALFLPRTEYHCARCGGHQGHIFNDGPKPLGKRWCNNGLALRFVAG